MLSNKGYSIHLFPLKHYLYEGHLHLPLVHKILNHDFLVSYIKFLSRLSLGKFRHYKTSISLDEYAEKHADYMCFFTNYLSYSDVLKLGKKHCLRTSFKYTENYYTSKLASILGLEAKYLYKNNKSSLMEWLSIHSLKYISSATLILYKSETYTH